jgi:hypothetical protein
MLMRIGLLVALVFFAVALVFFAVECFPAPSSASAAFSFQAACQGFGGEGTVIMRGRSTGGGLDADVSRTFDRSTGFWSESRRYASYTIASGFEGAVNWSQDRSGGSHQLNSPFARRLAQSDSWVLRRGWCDSKSAAIGASTEQTANHHLYKVFEFTPLGGAPIVLWMDPASGLPFRIVEQLSESHLSRTYTSWIVLADGTPVANKEILEYPEDEASETLTFTEIAQDAGPAKAAFRQPAPPNDYAILNDRLSTTVPYEADVDRIFVPVMIDGHGPLLFELDSGGHLILTSDAAASLDLRPVGAFSSTGAGQGIVKAGFVKVHEVRVGEAVIRDQPVKVLPLRAPSNDRGPRAPRSGILGLELFERFAVQLDRRAHSLTLTPLDKFKYVGPGRPLPLQFIEDAPLTQGAIQGIAGLVELDTGNSGPAILEGHWAAHHGLSDRFSHGILMSGSGVGGDYRETVNRAALRLGAFELPDELLSFVGIVERGAESVHWVAANFGEPILQQFDIAFDYRRNVVWLAPMANRTPRSFNRAGLGLTKNEPGLFAVTLVINGSPAARRGLSVGDSVVTINGTPASAMATSDAKLIFLKPAGTKISLTVRKATGEERVIVFALEDLV